MSTPKRPCNCKHEFQDATYGKGIRVHNQTKLKNGSYEDRCTVCGSKKPAQ